MSTPRTNFIGINVSDTQARATLIDDQGRILEKKVGDITPKNTVAQLAAMVEELRTRSETVLAMGVALSGLVNRQTDRVVAPRDLPANMVADLHGELSRATGLRVEL